MKQTGTSLIVATVNNSLSRNLITNLLRQSILLLFFSLIGCAQHVRDNSTFDSSPFVSNKYLASLNQACNIRFSDKAYCRCFSRLVYDNTPEKERSNLLSESKITNVLFNSLEKIEQRCERNAKYLHIPEFKKTSLLNKVLAVNKNKVLTPNLVADNSWKLDKPSGWEYSMESIEETEIKVSRKFIGTIGEELYFDYIYYQQDAPPSITAKYKLSKGKEYYLRKNVKPMRYEESEYKKCQFVVGNCMYGSRLKKQVYTEYRDGMWIKNSPAFSGQRSLEIFVYDLNGLPLYQYRKNLKKGNVTEKRRLERIRPVSGKAVCDWCTSGLMLPIEQK